MPEVSELKMVFTPGSLNHGLPTSGLWTKTSPWPVKNWAVDAPTLSWWSGRQGWVTSDLVSCSSQLPGLGGRYPNYNHPLVFQITGLGQRSLCVACQMGGLGKRRPWLPLPQTRTGQPALPGTLFKGCFPGSPETSWGAVLILQPPSPCKNCLPQTGPWCPKSWRLQL